MISKIVRAKFVCYEGEGGEGGGEGAGGEGAGGAAGGTPAAGSAGGATTFTQDQVNAVLAKEKRKFQAEREKLAKQLEDASKVKGLGDEEKAAFEAQIEELRSANLTVEEKARRDKDKVTKEWEGKFNDQSAQAKAWQERHNKLFIGHEIQAAANDAEVKALPGSIEFIEAKLMPSARLVEQMDEDNKGTGNYIAMVKMNSTDAKGKPVTLDLTIKDAMKLMKDSPDKYGFLFEGTASGGTGGTNKPGKTKAGGTPDNVADYLKAAKDNPALLGRA